jgi:hypothetical protein
VTPWATPWVISSVHRHWGVERRFEHTSTCQHSKPRLAKLLSMPCLDHTQADDFRRTLPTHSPPLPRPPTKSRRSPTSSPRSGRHTRKTRWPRYPPRSASSVCCTSPTRRVCGSRRPGSTARRGRMWGVWARLKTARQRERGMTNPSRARRRLGPSAEGGWMRERGGIGSWESCRRCGCTRWVEATFEIEYRGSTALDLGARSWSLRVYERADC